MIVYIFKLQCSFSFIFTDFARLFVTFFTNFFTTFWQFFATQTKRRKSVFTSCLYIL